MIQAVLCILSAAFAFTGWRVFAQGQANMPVLPQPSVPNGWLMFASSAMTSVAAVGYAAVTANAGALKRQIEDRDRQIKEIVGQLEERTDELKAAEKERDLWMRRAYSMGYRSSDQIPVHRDPGDREDRP